MQFIEKEITDMKDDVPVRFSFVQDNNGEWYMVPYDRVRAWYKLMDKLPDAREYDCPDYAEPAGDISRISFLNPKDDTS